MSNQTSAAEVVPAGRASLPRRVTMHAGYRWRNSAHPLLRNAHTAWDSRAGATLPAVVSHAGGVSVAYAGLPEGLAYALEFTELRREPGAGGSPRRVESVLRGRDLLVPDRLPAADVVVAGTSAAKARLLPARAALVLPMRVHLVVDTTGGREAVLRRVSRRERSQFAHDRRMARWTWERETDPAWFDLFYERMYRPTMWRRHGARARTESREVSRECLFRTGRLFFVRQGAERVAGSLCHWDPRSGTLTLRLLGVLDGADEHYASGGLKAIYHLLIAWAADSGVRRVDLQGTEPFLSKGTFQWKRRLGSRVVLPPNHFGGKRLWLQVRRDTPAVRDFLVANPALAEAADGSLTAVYPYDGRRAPRHEFSARSPGVAGRVDLDLDEFLEPLRDAG